jgi:hypothetical protein
MCQSGHLFVGGMSVVSTSTWPSPQGFHRTDVAIRVDFEISPCVESCRLTVCEGNDASPHFHLTAHVSAPSRLRANMQSGAICWIRGPVGTENAKEDEYSNLEYFA